MHPDFRSKQLQIDGRAFDVRPVSSSELKLVHAALHEIIATTNIYNERAKRYEHDYYTIECLNELAAEDPHFVTAAFSGRDVASFAICRSDNGPIWLSWFGVLPQFRGLNLGYAVLQSLMDTLPARKVFKVWCDTRANNKYSIPILTQVGFSKLCFIENHWCNQDYFLWERRTPGLWERTHEADV